MTDEMLVVMGWVAILIVTVGLIAAVFAVADAYREFKIARTVGNGRFLYAKSTLRSQTFRTIKLASLGMIALLVVANVENRRVPLTVLFMLVIVLTASDAVMDRVASHQISNHFKAKYRREGA